MEREYNKITQKAELKCIFKPETFFHLPVGDPKDTFFLPDLALSCYCFTPRYVLIVVSVRA